MDHASDVDCSSDESKVVEMPNFGPFCVVFILAQEDLDVLRVRYQISSKFRLEVTGPKDILDSSSILRSDCAL